MSESQCGLEIDNITLRLPERIIWTDTPRLKSLLVEQLNGCALMVDAGAVDTVDAAVLQLFASFMPAAADAGIFVEWEAVSQPFREAAAVTGLAAALELPESR